MYNFKEMSGYPPYWGFMGSAVNLAMNEPLDGLISPRQQKDYSENKYLLPPNVLRTLISEPALENLAQGMFQVRKQSSKFGKFDIHLRGLYEHSDGMNLQLPWDILTYVECDKHMCYTPVNVSFSHQIMTCKWDNDPIVDFEVKRRIIERQIYDLTTYPDVGISVSVYGLSFPEQFSHGMTDKILTGYPHDWDAELQKQWRGVKKIYDLGEPYGKYAFYFFRGIGATKDEFNNLINDGDFTFYNQEIARRWNQNFTKLIGNAWELDPMNLFAHQRYELLKCLGAEPEPVDNPITPSQYC